VISQTITRAHLRQRALEQLRCHSEDERGGQLPAALGRITLAYDLWSSQRRQQAAELLIDAVLDVVDLLERPQPKRRAR
jgi:hypothetical protein